MLVQRAIQYIYIYKGSEITQHNSINLILYNGIIIDLTVLFKKSSLVFKIIFI
jgi:hypothetical protein